LPFLLAPGPHQASLDSQQPLQVEIWDFDSMQACRQKRQWLSVETLNDSSTRVEEARNDQKKKDKEKATKKNKGKKG
jgi:hypothetical protein